MGGLNYWLLKETKGVRTLDKCILYCLKVIYLGLRILLRIALGRKRRDRIFIEQGFDFNTFLYRVFKILRLDNSMLLKISVPKYDYKFYCRINKIIIEFAIIVVIIIDMIRIFSVNFSGNSLYLLLYNQSAHS